MTTASPHPLYRPLPSLPPRQSAQRGAAHLLLVLMLVALAGLLSAWSSRTVLLGLQDSAALGQAQQARLAAQAALATAQSDVVQAQASADALSAVFGNTAQGQPCPSDLPAPRWQCTQAPPSPHANLPGWQTQTLLARDLIAAPHLWQLRVQARALSGQGQAAVRESLWVPLLPAAPRDTPAAAVLSNGCISPAASAALQLCPLPSAGTTAPGPNCSPNPQALVLQSQHVPDSDGNGLISGAERNACLALTAAQLPGGGLLLGPSQNQPRSPCSRAVWRSVLGEATPAQIQAWSQAQESNGLHAGSQPTRSVYWIDSPADWTQSLGSPQAPVLLVFSSQACAQRCPRLGPGVSVHGTVYLDAGCQDEKLRGWHAGNVYGLLALEGGWPEASGQVQARDYARQALLLPTPANPAQVQRVPGSHREGGP